jgi:predicted SprT family Zn-dependent metalloprotease
MKPTSELYQALEKAYEHFNCELFDHQLPTVIFTFQRKSGVMGYFSPERWGNQRGKKCNEIAINPSFFAQSRLIEICQTLAHEMVHCWQYHFGNPSRKSYHNLEWAKKMIEIGLMPSSTGEPGGKVTGQSMADYIIEEGLFIKAFESVAKSEKFDFPWFDRRALPRLYEPVIAPFRSQKERDTPVSAMEEGGLIAQMNEGVQSISLDTYFSGEQSAEKLSSLSPDTFVTLETAKKPTRTKYICKGCEAIVYGKSKLNISCDDCNCRFDSFES